MDTPPINSVSSFPRKAENPIIHTRLKVTQSPACAGDDAVERSIRTKFPLATPWPLS
jgi:hypothetical protein